MKQEVSSSSTIGSFALAIASALEAEGIDPAPVMAEAGIDLELAGDPEYRVSIATLRPVWETAVETTGNPAFGILVAEHIGPTTFHALGYALLASETLESALIRNARYQNLITDALTLRLDKTADGAIKMRVQNTAPVRAWEGLDCCMAWTVSVCRQLHGPSFAPKSVSASRPRPRELSGFQAFYRCSMSFNAPENALVFDPDTLLEPLRGRNQVLAEHSDQLVESYLAKRLKADISSQVYGSLMELLPSGECSQDTIARRLNMTVRNLQRKLSAEETSFSQVQEKARRELSETYMREPQFSLTEIAFLLGFADSSSFARAFRQWYGVSPSQYRASL